MATIQELADQLGGIQGTATPPAVSNEQIQNYFRDNPNANDADIYAAMNQYKVTPEQLASAMNYDPAMVASRYAAQQGIAAPLPQAPAPTAPTAAPTAAPVTNEQIQNWFRNNPNATDADISAAMNANNISQSQLSGAMGYDPSVVASRYTAVNSSANAPAIQNWFRNNPNANDADIYAAMNANGITQAELVGAMGYDPSVVASRYAAQQGIAAKPVTPVAPTTPTPVAPKTPTPVAPKTPTPVAPVTPITTRPVTPVPVAPVMPAPMTPGATTPFTPATPTTIGVPDSRLPTSNPNAPIRYDTFNNTGFDPNVNAQPDYNYAQQDVPYGLTAAQAAMTSGQQESERAQLLGLTLGEEALTEGQRAALQNLALTQQRTSGLYDKGIGYYEPYTQAGIGAYNQQAALSGALGPEAQQKAYAAYQQSPGVAFAQQEAERAILRNASALGGLGGGNVRDELSRRAVGTYMQDFQNQFGRLGDVSAQGYNAASQAANMRGMQAGSEQTLGMTAAQIPMNVGSAIAQGRFQTGQTIGGQRGQLGQVMGNQAYQAGSDIASAIANTTSSLSALTNAQGAGMSDIMSNTVNNVNNLYQAAAAGDSEAISQLQSILANLSTGAGSSYSNVPIVPGATTNLTGAVAGIASGFKQVEPTRGGYVTSGAGGGYGPNYNTPYKTPSAFTMPGLGIGG